MKLPNIQNIAIERIAAVDARRAINADWVETLAENIGAVGLISPIEVFQTLDDGAAYSLVTGGHRLAAANKLGWTEIAAIILTGEDLAAQTTLKLHEISENLVRNALSALDRAFDIAAWRDLYLATHAINKGGRPKSVNLNEWEEKLSATFAEGFSAAAQKALGISDRTVTNCLKVASIGEGMRRRLGLHPIADNQSELLLLAAQAPHRQTKIADLLLMTEGEGVGTVSAAIDRLDGTQAFPKAERWAAFSDKFSKMKEAEQFRFFEAQRASIELWMKAR